MNNKKSKAFISKEHIKLFLTFSLFYFVIKSIIDAVRGIELNANHLINTAIAALIVSVVFTFIVAYFNRKEDKKKGLE